MKPRIVFISHSAEMAGAEIFLSRVVPFIKDAEIKILFIGKDGPIIHDLASKGLDVERIQISESALAIKSRSRLISKTTLKAFKDFKSDIDAIVEVLKDFSASAVHTNSSKSHIYGSLASRKLGLKSYMHIHDLVSRGNFTFPNKAALLLAARLLATQVFVNSSVTKDSLGRNFWKHEPIVVDCPVPQWSIPPTARRFQMDGALNFGIVCRITPWKGIEKSIQTFAEIVKDKRYINSQLFIAGSTFQDGDSVYLDHLKRVVSGLGLNTKVKFLGFVDDTENLYDNLDVILHFSLTPEPFGQNLLEAKSRGCVVVTSDSGGAVDFIESEVDGLLISEVQPNEISSKFLSLTSEELKELSGRAITSVGLRFHSETIADHLSGVIWRHDSRFGTGPNSLLRVAHLDHASGRGGAELALDRMISLSHSWQPAVFVDAMSGVFRKSLDSAGRGTFNDVWWSSGRIRLNGQKSPHLLFREGVKQIRIATKLRRNIEFSSSGIVHVNTSRAIVAGWIATRANQKLVLHLRDDMAKVFPNNLFGRLLKRILFCKVVGVIANSKFTLDSFGPMPAGVKSLVIPSPVGTMPEIGFAQNPVSDRIVLGLVARLARWKGQDLLIDAVNLLQVARDDSEIWFVGSSDLEDSNYRFELEEKVNKLGLQERVKFIGHVDNVWEVLTQIDVCIQCSTTPEPMGQNVLQYLIAGKPIIASQEGGPAEWIVNGENGILVAPRNADELSNAIAHLLESRSERVRLGLNAQKTIPINFDQFNVNQFQLFLKSL